MVYERDFLTAAIKELRTELKAMEEDAQLYFIGKSLLDLYEHELRKYRRR